MYTKYWRLREKPFENSPDPKFLFHSKQHDEALMRLLYTIQSRKGAAMLTGDYGCGKTLLMHTIMTELSGGQFEIAFLTNPRMRANEMIHEILYQLEIDVSNDSRLNMLHTFNDFLFETARKKKHTIIILDEAQVITDLEVFEELRLMLNFQLNDRYLLTLFLVGQPELSESVKKLPQLNQRISVRYHLKRFTYEETISYMNHRLKIAGHQNSIFTEDAYKEIYQYSQGTPRIINDLCDLSLVIGFGKQVPVIDDRLIQNVISSEGRH